MGTARAGLCRLCKQHAKLVQAHLIPDSFYAQISDDNRRLLRVVTGRRGDTRIVQTGEFDRELICLQCEQSFSKCDAEAARVLLASHPQFTEVAATKVVVSDFDCDLMKRFALGTVWRIALSSRPLGHLVDLPEQDKERLRKFLLRPSVQAPWYFGVLWWRFRPSVRWPSRSGSVMVLDPHLSQIDGHRFVRLNLGRYGAMIHLEERELPRPWSSGLMVPGRLAFTLRTFDRSPECRLLEERFLWQAEPSPDRRDIEPLPG